MIEMIGKLRTAIGILRQDGLVGLGRRFYRRFIWDKMPEAEQYAMINDVAIAKTNSKSSRRVVRLGDQLLPWNTPGYIPDYKAANVDAVIRQCKLGDDVVIVGGGDGVTSVTAAREVGDSGEVTIYEADADRVRDLRRTLELNGVSDRCTLVHTVVGEAHNVANEAGSNSINASDLPACNLLEMDCEGAELAILASLTTRPRSIVVEIHHEYDFCEYDSPAVVLDQLHEMGYSTEMHHHRSANGVVSAVRDRPEH